MRFEESKNSTEYFLDRMERQSQNIKPREFKELLKESFIPLLREQGFKGTGNRYQNKSNPHIHFFVEFDAVPREYDRMRFSYGAKLEILEKAKLNPLFDHYLLLPNGNYDFDLGRTRDENYETISYLEAAYREQAMPFFELLKDFPGKLAQITLEDIKNYSPHFKSFFKFRHPVFAEPDPLQYSRKFHTLFCAIGDQSKIKDFSEYLIPLCGQELRFGTIEVDRIKRISAGDQNFGYSPEEQAARKVLKDEDQAFLDNLFDSK
ncbi:MAG: hypothetical protein EP338_11220 [Bacteroidetes bacterium]|nr:MAG: hypothetical protein EP338_11220 [Bacteroidota bacterium]